MANTLKHVALDDLRRRILICDLAPGSELDEAALAAHYGMSRTPLREVFQGLAGEGYVTLTAHRGARVAPLDIARLRGFQQLAPVVYVTAARLAAEHRTDEQMDDLKATQQHLLLASDTGTAQDAALLNHRFHVLVSEMAGTDYLGPSFVRLMIDHTRLSLAFYDPQAKKDRKRIKKALRQHEALIAALDARDAETAALVTLEHWDLTRAGLAAMAGPQALPIELPDPEAI